MGSFSLDDKTFDKIASRDNISRGNCSSYIIKVIDNWGYAYPYMIESLKTAIRNNMDRKTREVKGLQDELLKEFDSIK